MQNQAVYVLTHLTIGPLHGSSTIQHAAHVPLEQAHLEHRSVLLCPLLQGLWVAMLDNRTQIPDEPLWRRTCRVCAYVL